MFDELILEEFNRFKEMVDHGLLSDSKGNNFLSEDSFDEDFSMKEIKDSQAKLKKMINVYLKETNNEEYIVTSDWCIHVCNKIWLENLRNSRKNKQDTEMKEM